METKKSRELIRLSINQPKALIDKVDDYCLSLGVNRTVGITLLLSMALETTNNNKAIEKLMELYESKKR